MDWPYSGKTLESKNNLHRYLKLPFDIKKHPMCETVPDSYAHYDLDPYRDNLFEEWNRSLGLTTMHVEMFYTPPNGGELPIHADDVVINDRAKINITWGPAEGTFRWWTSDKVKIINSAKEAREMLGSELLIDDSATSIGKGDQWSDKKEGEHINLMARKEDCTLVYECNTNIPSLVNVGQLHSTWNPSTEPRWTLCFMSGSAAIRDGAYLTFEEACEAYQDFIIGEY